MMRRATGVIVGLVMFMNQLCAQRGTGHIEGTISTTDGRPVQEVNILLKELRKYTRTNDDGHFVFKHIPYGNYTLVYSFAGVGEKAVSVTVPPQEGATSSYSLPLSTKELQEVIVTAARNMNSGLSRIGKSQIPIMDLPQSVAVIGQTTIEAQQAQRLSEVIKNVNGVYVGGMRAGTQETFYARGYNFSNSNMFKNGFRVNTGSMPEMSGLEKVEILKGSAAILYGNVAPGGIVNMITKKPMFHFGGELNLRAGSFELYKPAFDIYGPLGIHAAFRANGTFETANSFRDVVHSKRYYFNPSLLLKPGDKTSLLLQGDYLNHQFTPDFGIGTLSDSVIADVPRNRFMGANWQYAKTAQTTASAELNHILNERWQLVAGLSYQQFHRDYFSLERIQAKANGDWGRPLGKTDNRENYFTGQANLNGQFSTGALKHRLLAGFDADRYQTAQLVSDMERKIYDSINLLDAQKFVRRTDMPIARWATLLETPFSAFGLYAQDLLSLAERWKLLAGIRWSYLKTGPVETSYLLKNDSTVLTTAHINHAFSPRIGIVYQPNNNTSLFASYANSFTPNTGTDIHFKPLPPSIIDQFELGIKNDLFSGKLNANLTYYHIVNNNLVQLAAFAADGKPNANSNIKELTGQTTSNGLEIDLRALPLRGLDIIAGYSYNDSRYTRASQQSTAYVNGQRLVNTPAHTANSSVFYTLCNGPLKGLKLGAGAYYVGERIGGWNYTIGNKRPLFPVKAFTTLDLSAGYHGRKLAVMAKLANVANTCNYYVHENYSINPIPPRNVMITVGYKF